eukprot:1154534-Pelagomonas_calceolata.AAC.1
MRWGTCTQSSTLSGCRSKCKAHRCKAQQVQNELRQEKSPARADSVQKRAYAKGAPGICVARYVHKSEL